MAGRRNAGSRAICRSRAVTGDALMAVRMPRSDTTALVDDIATLADTHRFRARHPSMGNMRDLW
jgi:hypothetical protein